MKRALIFITILLIVAAIACSISFFTDKSDYTKWEIQTQKPKGADVCWARFNWTNGNVFGKYYARNSMQIPCKIEGLPYNFTFQFDLGAVATGLNETTIKCFYKQFPYLKSRTGRLRSPLQFWWNKKTFKDLGILFGGYRANNRLSYLYEDYGEELQIDQHSLNDTFEIGSVGADMFQGKVLIIDYPNQRFAICDTVPEIYSGNMAPIDLDPAGRVLLPMLLKGKIYKTIFDNGSSLFPLIVTGDKIKDFSTSADNDTFKSYAWGKPITMIGRPMDSSFVLAGHTFAQKEVYADPRKEARTNLYDAITGNTLFWDNTIVIDFKNKKFALE